MILTNPAWLWLLAPWAGLVVLVLRAYRPKVAVPFLDLWPREGPTEDRRRAWKPPALPLLLLLLGMLAAIAALAQPAVRSSKPHLAKLSIIVDRGVTMLAGHRLRKATSAALTMIQLLVDEQTQIRVLDTRGRDEIVGPRVIKGLLDAGATAEQTHAKLYALEQRAVTEGSGPVLVISDATERHPSDRVIVCRPAGSVDDVGIVSASLLGDDCIVKLRNSSPRGGVTVTLTQGGSSKSTVARLGARGEVTTCTIPAARYDLAKVTLELEDDLPDDNVAWIWPAFAAARITTRGDLGETVRQFASSYAKARPAGNMAPSVLLTAEPTESQSEVIIPPTGDVRTLPDFTVVPDQPVLRNVVLPHWAKLAGTGLPAGNWRALLTVDGKTLLAVDDTSRGVWIGFAPADEAAVTDYIVLLTDCVEYCASGTVRTTGPRFLGEAWARLDPRSDIARADMGLRAGLYRRDGALVAMNVPAPELAEFVDEGNSDQQLMRMADRQSQTILGSWFWLAAVSLIGAGAAAACAFHCARATVSAS